MTYSVNVVLPEDEKVLLPFEAIPREGEWIEYPKGTYLRVSYVIHVHKKNRPFQTLLITEAAPKPKRPK